MARFLWGLHPIEKKESGDGGAGSVGIWRAKNWGKAAYRRGVQAAGSIGGEVGGIVGRVYFCRTTLRDSADGGQMLNHFMDDLF